LKTRKNVECEGIDLSIKNIETCIKKGLNVFHGDIDEGLEGYNDQCFDFAIINFTVPFLKKPEFILNRISQISKNIIVTFENVGYFIKRIKILFKGTIVKNPFQDNSEKGLLNERFFTIKQFMQLLIKNKFNIIQEIYFCKKLKIPKWLNPNLFARYALFVIKK